MRDKLFFAALIAFLLLGMTRPPSSSQNAWPKKIWKPSKYTSKLGFELGRALFYDPHLSADSSISCSSCHLSFTAFAHVDHPTSHGISNRIGRRNAPGLFNLAWRTAFHWDGGVHDLKSQALNPLTQPDEMGVKLEDLLARLNASPKYLAVFQKIYHCKTIQTWMLLDALAQFTSALVSDQSFYDEVKAGKQAFSEQQAKGEIAFNRFCNSCHQAPLFFSNDYASNRLEYTTDFGRFEITGNTADKGLFRIPTLRNISHTFPYMHDGRFKNLKEVLAHYGRVYQIDANQQKDIIAFLKTLTDTNFITNPKYQFHQIQTLP